MVRKTLPPLIEGWIRDLSDPGTNIYIRENTARELENVQELVGEALRRFALERNRVVDASFGRKRKRSG